jgi:hypothetical protein
MRQLPGLDTDSLVCFNIGNVANPNLLWALYLNRTQ